MRRNAEYPDSPPHAPITRLLLQMLSSAVLVALLLSSGSAIAQINGTGCTLSNLYVWVRCRDVSCQHTFDGLTDGLIQAYNSLNQNPCEVAAYLQSTCNGGCECSFVFRRLAIS